jgi:hypothetical protein
VTSAKTRAGPGIRVYGRSVPCPPRRRFGGREARGDDRLKRSAAK